MLDGAAQECQCGCGFVAVAYCFTNSSAKEACSAIVATLLVKFALILIDCMSVLVIISTFSFSYSCAVQLAVLSMSSSITLFAYATILCFAT